MEQKGLIEATLESTLVIANIASTLLLSCPLAQHLCEKVPFMACGTAAYPHPALPLCTSCTNSHKLSRSEGKLASGMGQKRRMTGTLGHLGSMFLAPVFMVNMSPMTRKAKISTRRAECVQMFLSVLRHHYCKQQPHVIFNILNCFFCCILSLKCFATFHDCAWVVWPMHSMIISSRWSYGWQW